MILGNCRQKAAPAVLALAVAVALLAAPACLADAEPPPGPAWSALAQCFSHLSQSYRHLKITEYTGELMAQRIGERCWEQHRSDKPARLPTDADCLWREAWAYRNAAHHGDSYIQMAYASYVCAPDLK